jgi:hypothetical protein
MNQRNFSNQKGLRILLTVAVIFDSFNSCLIFLSADFIACQENENVMTKVTSVRMIQLRNLTFSEAAMVFSCLAAVARFWS